MRVDAREEPASRPGAANPAGEPSDDAVRASSSGEVSEGTNASSEGPDARAARAPGERLEGKPGAPRVEPSDPLTYWVCTLMMTISMVMVVWHLQDSSLDNANTGSRYATIQSLAERGTYHIDKSRYSRTVDKYRVDGHYISSKPPTLPTYGAGVYWVYKQLTGKSISRHEGDVVRFVSLFTGGLFHLIFLIFFYRLCRLLLTRQLAIIGAMAAACFAYLGVGYATHINNHSIAASLAVVGFYYAYRARHGIDVRCWHYPLSGFVLGVLPAVDLPSLSISGLVFLYLLAHDHRRTLLYFLPAMLPGMACHLALNYHISGSFRPFQTNAELKDFKGNYFRNPAGIDGLREPKHIYAFHVLLGHHGLFSMTPLLGFGLYELGRSLVRRVRLGESLVVALPLLALLGFYIFRTRNYGGWCVGMRWLVPIMPLLLLYFGLWLERVRMRRWLWPIVLLCFGVSAFHVSDALTSPFQFSVWHNWIDGRPNRNRVGKRFNLPKRRKKRRTNGRRRAKPRRARKAVPSAPAKPAASKPTPQGPSSPEKSASPPAQP